jgi:LmbE family N-acetylglucosaminyl deacetylase
LTTSALPDAWETNGSGMSSPERRPVFLSPHYDDAALSCGGTLAAMVECGENPLILTVFGGEPTVPLNEFATDMHRSWGLDPERAIAHRRKEEQCAAEILGVESIWLDFPDAIYRGARYLNDDHLFGAIHPEEATLFKDIRKTISELLESRNIEPLAFYCPLGVGNHVDHQHVLAMARSLTYRGLRVFAWEDFPYSAGQAVDVCSVAAVRSGSSPEICELAEHHLTQRVAAINCYASQLAVIFRDLGEPAQTTRRYAESVGAGAPAERFWPIYGTPMPT